MQRSATDARSDLQDEIPDAAFVCPYCEADLGSGPDDPIRTWHTCPHCGEVLSLASQRAFERAVTNYRFAQELMTPELLDERKRPDHFSPQAKDALRTYQKSYTGIQLALKAQLPAEKLERSIEMMAEMARILQTHQMISTLEARYWIQLMVCQTARQEYEKIEQKLQEPRHNVLTRLIRHPHWRLRLSQLRRALARREERLMVLEQSMAFVDTLYVKKPEG